MRKNLLIPFLLLLVFLCSCGKVQQSHYILNGFESIQELYSIRPAIQLMDGAMDLADASSGMVKSGSFSGKLTYQRGNSPSMILHIQQTAYPDIDVKKIEKMTLSVYNNNDQDVPCQITLVGTDFAPLLTQDHSLAPGQWNDLELFLTDDSFLPEEVLGFGIRLDAPENSQFYLDDWSVTME